MSWSVTGSAGDLRPSVTLDRRDGRRLTRRLPGQVWIGQLQRDRGEPDVIAAYLAADRGIVWPGGEAVSGVRLCVTGAGFETGVV